MLQKRIDYGFNGFQVPFIPRAARSSRRRSLVQRNVEDNQLCAFDLLATVAGEILLNGESSHMTTPKTDSNSVQDVVMEENEVGQQSLIVENSDQDNVEAASPSLTLELGIPGLGPDHNVSPLHRVSLGPSLAKMDLNGIEYPEILSGNALDSHCIEHPEILDGKPPTLFDSDSSVKSTLGNDSYPYKSQFPIRDNNVNLVSKDDDENCSECIQPTITKNGRLPARIGDRRIRKLLASKYWEVASRARDGDLSDSEVRCLYRSRNTGYKHLRSQRIYPFKRRRFYHYSSQSNSHPYIGYNKGASSACVARQSTNFSSMESHVKLRINSFLVPELFFEMPETATIGSLKRTVMQAVSSLLGGGLQVGVRLERKKIKDNNRTLQQCGISNNNAESVGFSLVPNPSQVCAPVCSGDNSSALPTKLRQPLSRCPIANAIQQETFHISANHLVTNLGNFIESDHDSTPSQSDLSAEKGTVDYRAIVPLPEGTPQALSVVQSNHKSKRSDMCQRRIRRPFSVFEVEALVLAVEKLGTGRWRDVKLCAFDNAKHRTYVDLKDKWKTLVHTAKIAPQQRRGEPVPQELLDRVLAAHGYWTQQQLQQPPPVTCLLL